MFWIASTCWQEQHHKKELHPLLGYWMSDFIPSYWLPNLKRDGEHAWFLWAENSSRSPWHTWQKMYNCENKLHFCFREAMFSCAFKDNFLRFLNKGNWFSFITSLTSFICFIRFLCKSLKLLVARFLNSVDCGCHVCPGNFFHFQDKQFMAVFFKGIPQTIHGLHKSS